MKVTKHYADNHVVLKRRSSESRGQTRLGYAESRRRKAIASVTEGDLQTCITLDSDRQMKRLGECLTDLYRTDSREVTIEPNKG